MIEVPIGVLLLFLALVAALAVQMRAMQGRLDDATRTIRRQTRTIRRQMEATRQATCGLDPVDAYARELARDFGPGRKDLTAFFAECGRAHLAHTDISELQSPEDD
mgnify:CR=1 FL=1